MNKNFNFQNNNKAHIRRGQIISTFGPGALVNLELGTFIGMGIDSWIKTGPVDNIYEERLQKRLNVRYFRQPPSADTFPKGLPYRRFPRWLFCPKCRILKTYDNWVAKDTRKYPTLPKCTSCFKGLVPMSFLIACRKGHLDDFPWVEWIHEKKGICSPNPVLKYKTSLAGAGLAGSRIECMQCDAKRSMTGAFSKTAFNAKCNGSKPWAKEYDSHESCGEDIVTVQRGGSNVYFARVVSSITIPPYTDTLYESITENHNWALLTSADIEIDSSIKDKILASIAEQIGSTFEDVKKCVDEMERISSEAENQKEESFRFDEYQAFHGKYDTSQYHSKDFQVVKGDSNYDYSKYGIKDIFLVKSLREVRALIGFTRLRPYEQDLDYAGDDEKIEAAELVSLTDHEGRQSNWKPAIEVRGEGIFFTLDNNKLDNWSKDKDVIERVKQINNNYQISCNRRHAIYKQVNAKYILLHTLSHLLIRQLSFDSGYSGASLRERIYCNSTGDDEMQGILIYTAAGDSDGTLGGLVRQAKSERFTAVLNSLLENSKWCANDPLCIESKGQGFESLNFAACYACALLPETSCEEFNKFLDRALISGTPDSSNIGYFS